MKKKPAEPEPPEPSPEEPAPRTVGEAMQAKLQAQLRVAHGGAAAKAAMAAGLGPASDLLSIAKVRAELGDDILAASGLADFAKSLGGVTDNAAAAFAKSMGGLDLKGALGSDERWAGLIVQATETAKMAHDLAQPTFTVPESPLNTYLREYTPDLASNAVLPAMSAELARVGGLLEVMSRNVIDMAGLGQRAEQALGSLVAEAGQTRAETERLRGALEKGQHSAERLSWINLFATFVLVALTIVLAYLTYKLKSGG